MGVDDLNHSFDQQKETGLLIQEAAWIETYTPIQSHIGVWYYMYMYASAYLWIPS